MSSKRLHRRQFSYRAKEACREQKFTVALSNAWFDRSDMLGRGGNATSQLTEESREG